MPSPLQTIRPGFWLGLCCGFLAAYMLLAGARQESGEPVMQKTDMPAEMQPAKPIKLFIPAIGVEAPIQALGKAKGGDMDVPKNATDVSWYKHGPHPGLQGNAVIAGHLDTAQGKTAVFWRLRELKPNDLLVVEDEAGGSQLFRVRESKVYPYDQAPLEDIFGKSDGKHLNLITCNGAWNNRANTYNERVVVYTDSVSAIFSSSQSEN